MWMVTMPIQRRLLPPMPFFVDFLLKWIYISYRLYTKIDEKQIVYDVYAEPRTSFNFTNNGSFSHNK
jgi:hypothetical protein